MKRIKFLVAGAVMSLLNPTESFSAILDPETTLKKPIIMGASVSADYHSLSPGKRLALRYTQPNEIKMKAVGGRPGVETLKNFSAADIKDRTIILAVDLFFWDSTLSSIEPSLNALQKFTEEVKGAQRPIVIGEIPELLQGRQPHRQKLNEKLKSFCDSYSLCRIMPFDRLHKQALRDRYLEINGKKYTIQQLIPDGLHLSEVASNFLADQMLEIMKTPR